MTGAFMFFESFQSMIDEMPKEMGNRFYRYISEYGLYGTEPKDLDGGKESGVEHALWIPIRLSLDSMAKKGKRGRKARTSTKSDAVAQTEETIEKTESAVVEEESTENQTTGDTESTETAIEQNEQSFEIKAETKNTIADTPQKYFMQCWNSTKDDTGVCIFPVSSRIKDVAAWRSFWKNNSPTKEQIKTAFENVADGLSTGALQRQYLPSTPDGFVLGNWIYRSQTRYEKRGEKKEQGIDWTKENF